MDFLQWFKEKSENQIKVNQANEALVCELLQKGYIYGDSKNLTELDWWEPLWKPANGIVAGNIYMFLYKSDKFVIQTEDKDPSNPSNIKDKVKKNIKAYLEKVMLWIRGNSFFELIPMVLVRKCFTYNGEVYIHGINLNYCNFQITSALLEELYKIDPKYFDEDIWEMAKTGEWKPSVKISKTVVNDQWLKWLVKKFKINNVDLMSRTYKLSNMSKLRMVELWMYHYIPSFNCPACIEGKSLKSIQKMVLDTYLPYYRYPDEMSNPNKISISSSHK